MASGTIDSLTHRMRMTSCKPQIMARLTPKTAMWLWLIFGGIFAAFGISTFLGAIGSVGLIAPSVSFWR